MQAAVDKVRRDLEAPTKRGRKVATQFIDQLNCVENGPFADLGGLKERLCRRESEREGSAGQNPDEVLQAVTGVPTLYCLFRCHTHALIMLEISQLIVYVARGGVWRATNDVAVLQVICQSCSGSSKKNSFFRMSDAASAALEVA